MRCLEKKTRRRPFCSLLVLLAVLLAAGCGGEEQESAQGKGPRRKKRGKAKVETSQGATAARAKLQKINMPKTLSKTWFYDGDGVYALEAEWHADGSTLHFRTKQKRQSGPAQRSAKRGKAALAGTILGFYVSDYPRGPYTYLDRAVGAEAALNHPIPYAQVKHKHFKAVVFGADGKALHHTMPVSAAVRDYPAKRTAPRKDKDKDKKEGKKGEKPSKETPKKDEAPVEAPPKPCIAVVPFQNVTERDAHSRVYIGRGLSDVLRTYFVDVPQIDTPDPLYTDERLSREGGRRNRWRARALERVATAVRADMILTGKFELTATKLRVQLSRMDVETKGLWTSPWIEAPHADSDGMGRPLAEQLAASLKVKLDDALIQKFILKWQTLNTRRRAVDEALQRSAEDKHAEAVAAFERVKAEEVVDAEALLQLAESYRQQGNPLRAAQLTALATHLDDVIVSQVFLRDLSRTLRNTHNLAESLNVLADCRLEDSDWTWTQAMGLLDQALSGRVVKRTWTGPKKNYPTVAPAWEVTTDTLLVNPHVAHQRLVVFGSDDKTVVGKLGEGSRSRHRRGTARTDYARAEFYDTYVYDLVDGGLKWQKSKVMSGATTPVVLEDRLIGMGARGPVAVALADGKVLWENKQDVVVLPETVILAPGGATRPWWRSFEMHAVGKHLVAYHPQGQAMHVFRLDTGKHVGNVHHNGTWSAGGQFLLRRPDGPHFLRRGSGGLGKLTDENLANADALTEQFRMLADPNALLQGDMLYEMTQRVSSGRAKGADYFIVCSDVKKGDFKWVYPFFDHPGNPPLIAGGKLFVPRRSIITKKLSRLYMIDVNAKEAKSIDLGSLELSLYDPTLQLPDGKGILIGSQAAVSSETGEVIWVNLSLPATRHPRMVGRYLFAPPVLADPETGKIVMELQTSPAFDWNRVTLTSHAENLIVIRNTERSRRGQRSLEGTIWAYRVSGKPEPSTPTEVKPDAGPKVAKLSIDDAEKAFIDSRLSAPVDHLTDVFERIATAKYESSGEAKATVTYFAKLLKKRPHNGEHLLKLAQMTKDSVALSGQHDELMALLGEIAAHYKQDGDLVTKLNEEIQTVKNDKETAAAARQFFKSLKDREHDPLKDVPSGRPGRTAGVIPGPDRAWSVKLGKNDDNDRIVPTDSAVFVHQRRSGTLSALDPSNGERLWKQDEERVTNFVFYRGIVYALGQELRALTPASRLALWRKRIDAGSRGRTASLTAGAGHVFVALREGIQAFDWITGREVFRLMTPHKDWIEVHGSVLLAWTRNTGEMHAFDAATGARLWTGTVGQFDVFDGKIYGVEYVRGKDTLELKLSAGSVATGRMRLLGRYTFEPGRKTPKDVPAPVVTYEYIAAACGEYLIQVATADGELLKKRKLDAFVLRIPMVTPTQIFAIDAKKDLIAFDTTKEGKQVWPTSGKASVAVGPGTLYLLDENTLTAVKGTAEDFSEAHLKAVAKPNIAAQEEVVAVAKQSRVRKARFEDQGVIYGKKSLPKQMDDPRVKDIAFYQFINVGGLKDWEVMIDEALRRLPPGERKTRVLTSVEERALFAEIVQRRDAGSTRLLRRMLNSRDRAKVQMVLELMTTGSRATYGPVLTRVFRDAVKERQFITAGYCAEAVGRWRLDAGFTLLTRHLNNESSPSSLRQACAEAVANFTDRAEAVSALKRASRQEGSRDFPAKCLKLLVGMGDAGLKAVTAVLKDGSAPEENRIEAARALSGASGPDAAPALLAVLKSGGGKGALKLRSEAAAALGPLAADNDDAYKTLLDMMKDRKLDPHLRNACMHGFGLSGRMEAVPHLIDVMDNKNVDNHKYSRSNPYQFIVRITKHRRIGNDPRRWRRWWEENKERLLKEAQD